MTKKVFEVIARNVAKVEDEFVRKALAIHLAEDLASLNPAFNRARFLAACGVAI